MRPCAFRACPVLLVLFLFLPCTMGGCGHKVGVRETSDRSWFERKQRNALDSRDPSELTQVFLQREALERRHRRDPEAVIEELDLRLRSEKGRELAFHLAELCYIEARRHRKTSPKGIRYNFSASQYAYAYLFDPDLGKPANVYDRTFRWACDLYNRSLGNLIPFFEEVKPIGSGRPDWETVAGSIELVAGANQLSWVDALQADLHVSFHYEVFGLPESGQSGLGVPLVIVEQIPGGTEKRSTSPVRRAYSATGLLRFVPPLPEDGKAVTVSCDLFDPTLTDEIQIYAQKVPLEIELTSSLAYMLQQSSPTTGLRAMLDVRGHSETAGLFVFEPYRADKIPLVFVHGLMSDPLTWMPLLNDLRNDPVIRRRYQVWFFRYPTGNPLLVSARTLRRSLSRMEAKHDPQRQNPLFQDAVIVGHSMGGLLAKMQVLVSGNRMWNAYFDEPIEDFDFTAEELERVRSLLFWERQDFLKRIVFMAVPHRGASMARSWIGRFGNWLVDLPRDVSDTMEIVRERMASRARGQREQQRMSEKITGISGLTENSSGLLEICSWPYPPDVSVHSIIGNEAGTEPGGTDGVVAYSSSHIDGVESEVVIECNHRVHQTPEASLELRRILHLHLEEHDQKHAKKPDSTP